MCMHMCCVSVYKYACVARVCQYMYSLYTCVFASVHMCVCVCVCVCVRACVGKLCVYLASNIIFREPCLFSVKI